MRQERPRHSLLFGVSASPRMNSTSMTPPSSGRLSHAPSVSRSQRWASNIVRPPRFVRQKYGSVVADSLLTLRPAEHVGRLGVRRVGLGLLLRVPAPEALAAFVAEGRAHDGRCQRFVRETADGGETLVEQDPALPQQRCLLRRRRRLVDLVVVTRIEGHRSPFDRAGRFNHTLGIGAAAGVVGVSCACCDWAPVVVSLPELRSVPRRSSLRPPPACRASRGCRCPG